ncbi:GLPGLI family protein [Flavobacterium sp. F-380]|uniref:GLPGLI family protein n=1 Tax=Flavobacterium kayseriense TaxID=2764714 RepID=A0ABR7J5Z5_9FLAO|nr:GLPGLI family protein [Flavobacterium kayseriense]MBC5840960.1 GLPGLI family protein [Flavobacterium kayseriense]MBC5846371.1 GLPGLI family protein [Flavobacterium kayseriense]
MKKKVLLTLFFLITITHLHSQTLKGILTNIQLQGVGDETVLSKKASKPMTYSYTNSQNKSIQNLISIEKSSIDTTYIEKYGNKYQTTSTVNRPSSITSYKDFEEKKYKIISTMNDKDTNIKEALPTFNWKLVNESQTINGYACKKATTTNTTFNSNQSIVAWYCESIPLNDGPGQYWGLPGFIIQIEINKNAILTFDKLVFSKENTQINVPNNSAPELSYSDYLKQNSH